MASGFGDLTHWNLGSPGLQWSGRQEVPTSTPGAEHELPLELFPDIDKENSPRCKRTCASLWLRFSLALPIIAWLSSAPTTLSSLLQLGRGLKLGIRKGDQHSGNLKNNIINTKTSVKNSLITYIIQLMYDILMSHIYIDILHDIAINYM